MRINQIVKHTVSKIALFCALAILAVSCNKELPEATPIPAKDANSVATTIGAEISSNPEYSIYKAAATRVGMLAVLSDPTKIFTVFLPNNNAFIASGIPSEAAIAGMPVANVGGIVQYSLIPGQQIGADKIPSTFPNVQLPSYLSVPSPTGGPALLPGTVVPLQMFIFPSKRGSAVWANTMPVTAADKKFKNGTIHLVGGIVAPPTGLLKQLMYSNPQLTYFKAAIARADSGATGLNKLDSLLGYAVTNMTVLAPSDMAFQNLIFGSIFQHVLGLGADTATAMAQAGALSASPTVFQIPDLFPVLTAATVKGLLAYHFLATNVGQGFQPNIRVFSNNFATTPTFYKTLVNSSVGIHPGIMAQATFTGPFVSNLTFTGMGTFPPGGAPFSGAPAKVIDKGMDKLAVNGVYHIIDKVLLPQ